MPQPNSSTEEAITSQSSTLPVAFHSGFLPISPKTGFFHTKHVSKRFPTAFLVLVTLCSSTLEVLSYFTTIFATSVANTLSARARTTKNTEKCQKQHFFFTFAPKIGLFSLKTAAKAHTELQYRRINLTKRFPIKKYAIENFFHTTLQNVDFSGLRGGTFAVFFLNIQTSQRKTVCTAGNVSTGSTFPPNPILL